MPVVAAAVLLACLAFAAVVWHRRQGRENTAELDEAIGRAREEIRELNWRRAVIPSAVVVALVLLATLARNPSRWALLLAALAGLTGAVIAFVVSERRRRAG
jgi:Na+/H+ antiporter NhaD/arsenite permease-like protein